MHSKQKESKAMAATTASGERQQSVEANGGNGFKEPNSRSTQRRQPTTSGSRQQERQAATEQLAAAAGGNKCGH